ILRQSLTSNGQRQAPYLQQPTAVQRAVLSTSSRSSHRRYLRPYRGHPKRPANPRVWPAETATLCYQLQLICPVSCLSADSLHCPDGCWSNRCSLCLCT
ncbi:hypothetical protein BaRGS_00004105, partial [Batillaria attramentaria]